MHISNLGRKDDSRGFQIRESAWGGLGKSLGSLRNSHSPPVLPWWLFQGHHRKEYRKEIYRKEYFPTSLAASGRQAASLRLMRRKRKSARMFLGKAFLLNKKKKKLNRTDTCQEMSLNTHVSLPTFCLCTALKLNLLWPSCCHCNQKWGLVSCYSKVNRKARLVERKVCFILDPDNCCGGGQVPVQRPTLSHPTPTISEQEF